MFIAQNNKSENKFTKYIVGSLMIILGSFIGQIPLGIAIMYQIFVHKKTYPTTDIQLYSMFESNLFLFLVMISFVVAFLTLYLVVKKYHQQQFISIITSRNKIDYKRCITSFSIWVFISVTTILTSYFSKDSTIVLQFELVPFLILFFIAIIFIPIQTSLEELVFRGYLMQGFYNLSQTKWIPLIMTSIIFGGLHWFNPEVSEMGSLVMIYYIGTGLFLGVITLMDEGTELALGFHAANNLVASLLVTTSYGVLQTHAIFKELSKPSIGFEIFMPLVFYIILVFIFAEKYKWHQWKEKLIGNNKRL
ncbi:MAG TPA: CPBP family intramembrane metalloprotease domain-containing protein [Flavobacterium sp.]|nr:CPBP family intramembrane metalloprotease domain-containing protein [Flavobacterium sp.]